MTKRKNPADIKPSGRPSMLTEELATRIFGRMAEGESLRKICNDDGMPHIGTIMRWCGENPTFGEQYAHACLTRADTWFEESLSIADDAKEENNSINHARLRIDTRKWAAAQMNPKKYGKTAESQTNVTVNVTRVELVAPDMSSGEAIELQDAETIEDDS